MTGSGYSGEPSVEDGELPNGTGRVWHTRWSRIHTNAMMPSANVHATAIIVFLSNETEPVTSADPTVGDNGTDSSRFSTVVLLRGRPCIAELSYVHIVTPDAASAWTATSPSNRYL